MTKKRSSFMEAIYYQNGFNDGKNGKAKSIASRLQTGRKREAYEEGYEDGLRQREADGHTRINFD